MASDAAADDMARTPPEPAADAVEGLVLSVIQEMLRAPTAGLEDNFFELGGHSLMAMRIAGRLASVGVNVNPINFWTERTIRAIAATAQTEMPGSASHHETQAPQSHRHEEGT